MQLDIIKNLSPILLKGSLVTIELTIISIVFGTILGVVVAMLKLSSNKVISGIMSFYTWLFRGTPLLLQIFVFYYGLPSVGIKLTSFQSAIIGLSLNSGAYMAEIIRGGILSIDKGQFEACKALGFTYFQTMKRVVLPQTFKNIIPPVGNEFIMMIKDTSLVSVIAMEELMRRANIFASATGRAMEPYLIAASLYLIMTTIFTTVFSNLEKKLSVY